MVLLLLLAAAGGGWFVLGSDSGLKLLRSLADGRGPLTIGAAEGRLLGRFTLERLGLALPGVEVKMRRLTWHWSPLELVQGRFHLAALELEGVVVRFADGQEEPADAKAAAAPSAPAPSAAPALPATLLPLPLLLDRVAIDGLRLEDGEGGELFVIDTFLLAVQGGVDNLRIDTLTLQGPDLGLSVHGNVDFARSWHVDLLGSWNLIGYGFNRLHGTLSASGPLNSPQAALAVVTPVDLRVEGQVANLLRSPSWTATLVGNNVDLEQFIDSCPKIIVKTIHGDLAGDVNGYGGPVRAEVDWGLADNMVLDTTLRAGLLGIDFVTLHLARGEASIVSSNASIDWKRLFDWRGSFTVKNFDPAMFLPELPGSVSGEIESVGLVRDDLGVDADFTLQLTGQLHGRPMSVAGGLALDENGISSKGLTLRSGEVAGSAEVIAASFSWAKELDYMFSLRLEGFDPSGVFPRFPGSLHGLIDGRGRLGEGGGPGSFSIAGLSGTLRGNAISGGGEIALDGERLTTTGLVLSSGPSRLAVQGKAGEDFALDIAFDSPDLGTLLPESGGELHLRGQLRGSPQEPSLALDFDGSALQYGSTSVARLEGTLTSGFAGDGQLHGALAAKGLLVEGTRLDGLRLDYGGSFSQLGLDLDLNGAFGTVAGRVELRRDEAWKGRVADLKLSSATYGQWFQGSPAAFALGEEKFDLEQLCLAEGAERFCLGGGADWAGELTWRLAAEGEGLALERLQRWGLSAQALSGKLALALKAGGREKRLTALEARLSLPQLEVDLGLDDEELAGPLLRDITVSLGLSAEALRGHGEATMKSGSRILLDAALNGEEISPATFMSLPLSGRLQLADFDLAMLAAFTGSGVDPVGQASGDFTLGGSLGRPQLVGEGRVDRGGINLPYQGIALEQLKVKIEAEDEGVHLSGSTVSGAGEARVDGRLRYGAQGIEGLLHLSGKNVLLVNLPEYSIVVDPAVDLRLAAGGAAITGAVAIPSALITPEEMKDSVTESPDVVLVNGREEVAGGGWPFSVDLDIALGEAVRIDGYGLSGRLDGHLRVKTAAGELPTALGELDLLEGTFTIYGRTLDIARGRILFTGGPADNPGIDVRAQRTFSDEVAKRRGYTVGVDISGLAQDLKFQLFSDPYMDDTEILSQLIVGRSLAFSTAEESGLLGEAAATLGLKGGSELFQGIGSILQLDDMHLEGSSKKEDVSLVVGKRLTEDLYIGYDVNMFSQLGRFRVRYDLTGGFAVETSSSSQSTGADLLYSFEK